MNLHLLPGTATALSFCFAAVASAQTTTLVTHGIDGQADAGSLYPEISANGRWIVFQSGATNLVDGDTNDAPDIFVYDVQTGTTARASVDSSEQEANGDCLDPAMSLDGRFVSYFSYATNLVPGDTNGKPDVFVRDMQTGSTVRVSVGSGGVQADGSSRYPSVSGDGRYVAFESLATNLVAGDTNGVRDLYVHDLQTGVTVRASVSAGGQGGDGESLDASISPGGRYVAFESVAANLVPSDTNGASDVFVKDLLSGAIVRVSVSSSGVEGNGESRDASLSDHGERVCFSSEASNLVPGDGNAYEDVFVHDLASGITERVSVAWNGGSAHVGGYEGALSADGGYVAFFSQSSNLVPGDTNQVGDIFVRDLQAGTTERVSIGSLGQEGDGISLYPGITPGGRYVTFDSVSENLVVGDENLLRDIFLHDRYSPFQPFCAGDGSLLTACPCGNTGSAGHGCENSAETGGATLVASGDPSLDAVRLDAAGELSNAVSIFVQGSASTSSGVVFGDGVRCVSGNLTRLYTKLAGDGAACAPGPWDVSITVRSATFGDPIAPGSARFYQVYYRDADAAFCPPGTFNVTNGVRVQW